MIITDEMIAVPPREVWVEVGTSLVVKFGWAAFYFVMGYIAQITLKSVVMGVLSLVAGIALLAIVVLLEYRRAETRLRRTQGRRTGEHL